MQNINTPILVKNINGLWNTIDAMNMIINDSTNKIEEYGNKIEENTNKIEDIERGSKLFKEKELNGNKIPLIDMGASNNLFIKYTKYGYGDSEEEQRISMETVNDKSYMTFNSNVLADSLNCKNGTTWTSSHHGVQTIIYFNGYLHGITEGDNNVQKYYVTSKNNGKNWTNEYMDMIKCEYLEKVNEILFRIADGKLQCLLKNSTVWDDILDDAFGCIMKYVNNNYILIRNDLGGEKNIFKLSQDMKTWVDIPVMENYPLINEVLFADSKYILQFSNTSGISNAINIRNDILLDENLQYEVNDTISSNIQIWYRHIYFGTTSNKIIMLDYEITDPQEYNSVGRVMVIKEVPQGVFATGLFDGFLVLKESDAQTNNWNLSSGSDSKIKPSDDGIPPFIDTQQYEWTYVITQDGTGNVATWYGAKEEPYWRNFSILNDCKILKGEDGKILSDKKLFMLNGDDGGHCYEVYPSNFQDTISTPFVDYIYYANQYHELKEIIVNNHGDLAIAEINVLNVDISSINNKLTNINYSDNVTTVNGTLNASEDVTINGTLNVVGEITSQTITENTNKITENTTKITEQAEKITLLETKIANIKNDIYPINSIVYLSVDTNPSDSSVLGFGTWEKVETASVNGVFAYKRTV